MPDKPPGKQPESRKQPDEEGGRKGVLIRAIVLAAGLLLAGAFIVDWNALVWEGARRETNDAQLRGDPTQLAARVSGNIIEVAVTDYQPVHAGDLLYRIEDDDYQARVDRAAADVAAAEAGVALAEAQVASQRSEVGVAVAATRQDGAQLERARLERIRQGQLLGTESGLKRAWEAAVADERRYGATLSGDKSAVGAARADIGVQQAQADQARATLQAQRAALALAQVNLGYTRITAPVDGVVGLRQVFRGQYVGPGTMLITLVPLADIWVVANYREEQLTHMQPGQAAEIRVDAFPGTLLHGVVQSIEPTSEAQSSLLRPNRAVGNFTKIVQRVPVKITIDGMGDPARPLAGRLVPGLSVETTVDTATVGSPVNSP